MKSYKKSIPEAGDLLDAHIYRPKNKGA